jgi:hypothetical protein
MIEIAEAVAIISFLLMVSVACGAVTILIIAWAVDALKEAKDYVAKKYESRDL